MPNDHQDDKPKANEEQPDDDLKLEDITQMHKKRPSLSCLEGSPDKIEVEVPKENLITEFASNNYWKPMSVADDELDSLLKEYN